MDGKKKTLSEILSHAVNHFGLSAEDVLSGKSSFKTEAAMNLFAIKARKAGHDIHAVIECLQQCQKASVIEALTKAGYDPGAIREAFPTE